MSLPARDSPLRPPTSPQLFPCRRKSESSVYHTVRHTMVSGYARKCHGCTRSWMGRLSQPLQRSHPKNVEFFAFGPYLRQDDTPLVWATIVARLAVLMGRRLSARFLRHSPTTTLVRSTILGGWLSSCGGQGLMHPLDGTSDLKRVGPFLISRRSSPTFPPPSLRSSSSLCLAAETQTCQIVTHRVRTACISRA